MGGSFSPLFPLRVLLFLFAPFSCRAASFSLPVRRSAGAAGCAARDGGTTRSRDGGANRAYAMAITESLISYVKLQVPEKVAG